MADLKVCRYLTTRDPLPPWSLTGYEYILAGNGLWKRARNRHCFACLRLCAQNVAGLPDLAGYLALTGPKLPGRLLWVALEDARRRSWREPVEAMYHVYRHDDGRVRLAYPPQENGAARAAYQGGADPAIILDVHSHVEMAAFFSGADDRDELGFRFYAVMGRIFTRPEIRLRLGIYGDHWELPITALFADSGPFNLHHTRDEMEETWTFDQSDDTE